MRSVCEKKHTDTPLMASEICYTYKSTIPILVTARGSRLVVEADGFVRSTNWVLTS